VTKSSVVCTDAPDGVTAGRQLAEKLLAEDRDQPPDALILFVSPKYDAPSFLRAVEDGCRPKAMVGCSSAGEFTHLSNGEGQACAIALWSDEMRFACGIGRGLTRDRAAVAGDVVRAFAGVGGYTHSHSSALVLTDALAGHADELIEQLTLKTGGGYQFFGGGAGDDANFRRTQVFCGTEVASDAAVALEILSKKPLGVGVQHGWEPSGKPMRVTAAVGARIESLNAAAAVEAFRDHAEATGQRFDADNPIPFFLHNILGIETGQGHKLRVPLAVNADGSVSCAAEIPTGATVRIMRTSLASAADAAAKATGMALERLNGHKPNVAIFFDCVATRLRMGGEFGLELDSLKRALGGAGFAGCNTYGQVARAEGQFGGFHNCTAVVCVIPE
jgi:hypothetical protein